MDTRDDGTDDEPIDLGPDELGPFRPPAGYRFEEEFRHDPPRPRPPELSEGRHAVRERNAVWAALTAGAILAAVGPLEVVQTWGLYFVPFAYLTWIGLAILGIGVIALVSNAVRKGPYRYVEEGVPVVARVRSLGLQVTSVVNGQPAGYRYDALIDYPDPESGDLMVAAVSSTPINAGEKDALTTSYRVGDYATAVYLPHDPSGTIRLYGFLDLRPGLGLIRRDGVRKRGPLKTLATVVACFGFFGALIWDLYAFGRYSPLSINAGQILVPFGVGAVVLGGGFIALLAGHQAHGRRLLDERNALAADRGEPVEAPSGRRRGLLGEHGLFLDVVTIFGLMLLSGGTVYSWCLTANAWLDDSPARLEPVQIDRTVRVIHRAIFREYKIEYHFLRGWPGKQSLLSSPSEIARFDTDAAVAEVHDGRLGWPWVKALDPAPPAVRPAFFPAPGPAPPRPGKPAG